MKTNHNNYLKLAFNLAKVNLGKTGLNPSVGCVVVRNNTVISSGYTSINGRPHAEFNALNSKKDFKNSDLYVTMEPCSHYGLTPPCTKVIKKKGIKRIYFSFYDIDKKTARKINKVFSKKKIKVYKKFNKDFKNFYQSYFLHKKNNIPLIDAKIAISRDYFTINKKDKWITNFLSRNRTHLIRSQYDSIMSTSKSINKDNSSLNCRLKGFNNNKPDLIIIDLKLKIKMNLKLFKITQKRKTLIITSTIKSKKIDNLRKKGIKIIYIKTLVTKNDFKYLFKILKRYGYNRILVESGLIFLNKLLKERLINNLYMFQSFYKLKNFGFNNTSNSFIKRIKLNKKINVNLNGDKLYKIKIN